MDQKFIIEGAILNFFTYTKHTIVSGHWAKLGATLSCTVIFRSKYGNAFMGRGSEFFMLLCNVLTVAHNDKQNMGFRGG